MCAARPRHKDLDTIASKIWLIGRSYAAAIERGAGNQIKEGEDFYMQKVAPKVLSSKIDQQIAKIRRIKRLTAKNIAESLHCHKYVMDLFTKIAGGTTKRSLASKYLHFHAPNAFFIYDSRAHKKVQQAFPDKRKYFDKSISNCDREYQIFCARCLSCRNKYNNQFHYPLHHNRFPKF